MIVKQYKTNVTSQHIADFLIVCLQGIIADFIIDFDHQNYVLTVKGHREVSNIVIELLNQHRIEYQKLN